MADLLKILRPVLIFLALSGLASLILFATVPPLTTWHETNCATSASGSCETAYAFLRYWWNA